jgi:hypothetical protein
METHRDLCKTPPFASRYCGTLGSNLNPQNTQCMDACPDFIGVVKIFACLELEPQLNIKNRFNGAGKIEHFSKLSICRRS